ncbi:YezD family protein [Cellulosilyticum sp. ST5]|nr:YezD family protein [Cellulosilyticum sp. WCF-2]
MPDKNNQEEVKKVLQIIETIKYGSVTVMIQDGKIVQIEKNEKLRIK